MEHGLQTSLKTYALLMEDKMAARAFGLATNYGQDGTFNLFQAECIQPGKSLTGNGIFTPTITPKYSKQIAFKDIIPGTCNVSGHYRIRRLPFLLPAVVSWSECATFASHYTNTGALLTNYSTSGIARIARSVRLNAHEESKEKKTRQTCFCAHFSLGNLCRH